MTDVNADSGFEVEVDDQPVVDEIEDVQLEEQEPSEPSEPSTEEEQPESGYEKRIAKLTHKLRRAEEQLSKYAEPEVKPQPLPDIPALPDPDLRLDDPVEYARQVRARDEALYHRAEMEAVNKMQAKSAAAAQEAQAIEQQKTVSAIVDSYAKRGEESGLTRDRMAYNDSVLQDAGIGRDLGMYLYEDDSGPKIIDHLARNQSELDKVAAMSPARAAEYIALSIKPKVVSVKPRTTSAPDPVKPVKGSGVADGAKPLSHGYKIET